MNNIDILKKAIEKAVDNGFRSGDLDLHDSDMLRLYGVDTPKKALVVSIIRECVGGGGCGIFPLIYDHRFAQAFWGDMGWCPVCGVAKRHKSICSYKGFPFRAWEHHLQRMVLYQNPLEYLENFL